MPRVPVRFRLSCKSGSNPWLCIEGRPAQSGPARRSDSCRRRGRWSRRGLRAWKRPQSPLPRQRSRRRRLTRARRTARARACAWGIRNPAEAQAVASNRAEKPARCRRTLARPAGAGARERPVDRALAARSLTARPGATVAYSCVTCRDRRQDQHAHRANRGNSRIQMVYEV